MIVLVGVIGLIMGFYFCFMMLYRPIIKRLQFSEKISSKHLALFVLMTRWFDLKKQQKDLGTFFIKRGFNRIAVYGMGEVGKRLVQELENGNVTIEYGIDRQDKTSENGIRIIKPYEPFDDVDLMVVTTIGDYEDVFELISSKLKCPIISIEDVLFAYDTSIFL